MTSPSEASESDDRSTEDVAPDPYACLPTTRRCMTGFCSVVILLGMVLFVFGFVVIPVITFCMIALPFYYCFSSNPMPLGILLHTRLGSPEFHCPFWRDSDIQTSLVRRRCQGQRVIEVPNGSEETQNHKTEDEYTILIDDQDLESGNSRLAMVFSKPLARDEIFALSGKKSNDGKAIETQNEEVSSSSKGQSLETASTSSSPENSDEEPPCKSFSMFSFSPPPGLSTDDSDESDFVSETTTEQCPSTCCCLICFSAFREGEVVAWSRFEGCSHPYHLECITPWIRKSRPNCPVCRTDYDIVWSGEKH